MIYLVAIAVFSVLFNIFLVWYLVRMLRKFLFISENLSDLFLVTKAFQVFVVNLYSMESYHGEPMIQEMVHRIKQVSDEIDVFRDTFEYTLDEELEDELDDVYQEDETQEVD